VGLVRKACAETLEVPVRCETPYIQAILEDSSEGMETIHFQLRQDFIRKELEPFTRHPFIILEQWKEFIRGNRASLIC
jgi:hypothetical protein